MNKKAVFILMGQSNAVGHALPMAEEDKILSPMKNVFGLHRDHNQSFDVEKLTWSGYTSDGMNLGETQDHTYSIANCLAANWQAHIDAGNERNLPDLYIVQIAIGAEGVSQKFMWYPEREKVLIPGKLGKVNISLFPFSMHILSLVEKSLGDCDFVGLHWRGGEQDISAILEDDSIDIAGIYTTMIQGFNKALKTPPMVLHKIVAKDRMLLDETGKKLQIMYDINDIFDALTKQYSNVTTFDVRSFPGYDSSVPGEGLFMDDHVHFTVDVNKWVAKEIFEGYTPNK